MFYTAENRDRRLSYSVKERVILGRGGRTLCSRSPVVGRLISYKNIKSFSGKEALLAVVCGAAYEYDPCFFDDPRTVGVVFVSDSETEMTELPHPSITVYELPSEYNGRIALLDPEGERVFISPDISTVNKYLPRLFHRSEDSLPSFVLRDGKKLSLSVIREDGKDGHEGDIILPLPDLNDAEELYGRCAETVENATGKQVTFLISAEKISVSAISALMRSAVWGDVSVLLRGILNEDELTAFLQSFCHAFCELETDRREFNGYISRGLLIDSPYLLSLAEGLYGVDFFVFDAEALLSLFSGGRKGPPEEVFSHILTQISAVVSKRKDVPCGALLGENTLSPSFCAALERCGVERYVTAPRLYKKLYRILGGQNLYIDKSSDI